MAVSTLDATASGTSSNCYVTLAEANQYFSDRPGSSTWTSATDDEKNQSLLFATKIIDKLNFFRGEKTDPDQALAFPRKYLPDPDPDVKYTSDALRLRERYLDDTTVPDRVKYATYEQAFSVLKEPARFEDPELQQYEKIKIDGVMEVQINKNKLVRQISRNAMSWIKPLLRFGGLPKIYRA